MTYTLSEVEIEVEPEEEKETTEQNSRLEKQHQLPQQQKLPQKRKIKIFDYLNSKMQRKIGTEIELAQTVSPFDRVGTSSTIDRTASNYTDASDKVRKIRKLIDTGTYDADITRYIPVNLRSRFSRHP